MGPRAEFRAVRWLGVQYDSGMRRAVTLLAAVLATGCTSSARTDAPVLSPAPTPCPTGIVRANSIPASDLVDQMKGHVPLSLPSGFGLSEAWSDGDGFIGAALWSDVGCREVSVALASHRAEPPDGPRVGAWTVTVNAPGACGNSVLGDARCLGYLTNVDDGTLIVRMMGLDRAEGDEIVLSIPT